MAREVDVIVAGATGMVGRKMMQVLEERRFPVRRLLPMASSRSAGTQVVFGGETLTVTELTDDALRNSGAPIALFSAGAGVSRRFAPVAAAAGTLVIDNSSAFRMEPEVPLVVPEVNPADIDRHRGIIANPNCSTIQMVVALKPLHDRYRIRRIVVATYQSVTGAGQRGYQQLMDELSDHGTGRASGAGAAKGAGEGILKETLQDAVTKKFPHRIAFNCLPQIDEFQDDGYTKEEHKMMDETRKIMGDASIMVNATCVRVPVIGGHSEAVTVEFERPFEVEEVRALLAGAPGVVLRDNPRAREYPMPIDSHDTDPVYVGRLRRDPSVENGLNLWIVSDNLRKGAATNAVQIAEAWVRRGVAG